MRIELTGKIVFTSQALPYQGSVYRIDTCAPGSVVVMDDDKAQSLIDSGLAKPFELPAAAGESVEGS